jgi:signal transduction histidine kinase
MKDTPQHDQDAAVKRFVLGVAHELNNPNTFIRMNMVNLRRLVEMAEPVFSEWKSMHPDWKAGAFSIDDIRFQMLRLLDSTLEASVRLIALTDNLKKLGNLDFKNMGPQNLNHLLKNLLVSHGFLFDMVGSYEFDPCPEEVSVLGHGLELEQAFSVIIANAVDAMREYYAKEIELGQKPALFKVSLNFLPKEHKLNIHFKDNGPGMSEEVRKRIFEMYFTTKQFGIGSGIGLALCRSIIVAHEGSIDVDTEPGRGTDFIVTFPTMAMKE